MAFDLDQEVKSKFAGLVGVMRAKRLSGELPHADAKVNDEAEKPGDADGDQEAIESMLGSFDNDADDPAKKA